MSFGLKNCECCGKVFSGPRDMCPYCIAKEEEACKKAYDYLRENSNVLLAELSAETGVEEELILRFIREGRIKVSNVDSIIASFRKGKCILCGRTAEKGDYCLTCLTILKTAKSSTSDTLAERSGIVKDSVHSEYRAI